MRYVPRVADADLAARLRRAGAVVIEGPKACGKTETALQVARSAVHLDRDDAARDLAELEPRLVLAGDTPRLLDEWHLAPRLWAAARSAVDERKSKGQFILTGSARPSADITRHSGTGRMSFMRMRPMSLFEMGASNGAVSLTSLLAGAAPSQPDSGTRLEDLLEALCRGGWPGFLDLPLVDAQASVVDYLESVIRVDINELDDRSRRDPGKVGALVRSLARNTATHASQLTLVSDAEREGTAPGRASAAEYLAALRDLHVIEEQPSWNSHLRSRTRANQAAKWHFVDPSLAVAALRTNPAQLLTDLNFLGLLFESLVTRDLRVYAGAFSGEVTQYAEQSQRLKVDAIVASGETGQWAACEVKLGASKQVVDAAASSLFRFTERLSVRAPAPALVVIVGSGAAYLRPDGVAVVPIGLLGP